MHKIAVAQILSTPSVQSNLATCCSLIEEAAKGGARAIFLPEASDFIAPKSLAHSLAQPLDGQFVSCIRNAAKQNNIIVSIGIHERILNASKLFNSQLLIDQAGEIIGHYRKIHLFDVEVSGTTKYLESETTMEGEIILDPVPTKVGAIGLATCYDMRFPEQSIKLRKLGADIITFPSAFTPETGRAHWEVLLRARAIETQSYVVAAAQVGTHFAGRSTYGHAMIVGPWGDVLANCGTNSNLVEYADIDHKFLLDIRARMPTFLHRRPSLYT